MCAARGLEMCVSLCSSLMDATSLILDVGRVCLLPLRCAGSWARGDAYIKGPLQPNVKPAINSCRRNHHFERFGVGDAQPVDELRLLAELLQQQHPHIRLRLAARSPQKLTASANGSVSSTPFDINRAASIQDALQGSDAAYVLNPPFYFGGKHPSVLSQTFADNLGGE